MFLRQPFIVFFCIIYASIPSLSHKTLIADAYQQLSYLPVRLKSASLKVGGAFILVPQCWRRKHNHRGRCSCGGLRISTVMKAPVWGARKAL